MEWSALSKTKINLRKKRYFVKLYRKKEEFGGKTDCPSVPILPTSTGNRCDPGSPRGQPIPSTIEGATASVRSAGKHYFGKVCACLEEYANHAIRSPGLLDDVLLPVLFPLFYQIHASFFFSRLCAIVGWMKRLG